MTYKVPLETSDDVTAKLSCGHEGSAAEELQVGRVELRLHHGHEGPEQQRLFSSAQGGDDSASSAWSRGTTRRRYCVAVGALASLSSVS